MCVFVSMCVCFSERVCVSVNDNENERVCVSVSESERVFVSVNVKEEVPMSV